MTRDASAVKVRHEPVQHAKEGRLPAAGGSGDYCDSIAEVKAHAVERGERAVRIPVRQVGQACRDHTSTGMNNRRHAMSAGRSSCGAVNDGYANQSFAPPIAWSAMNNTTARPEAAMTIQWSHSRFLFWNALREAEPKPLASIDSASWIELSTPLSTTATTTSAHEPGQRGRHPRSRWASRTPPNAATTPGGRSIAAAL